MLAGSVDTNVLVRLLTQDDEPQAQAVDRLLAQHAQKGQLFFVPITVVLELEWVLRSRLSQGKAEVIRTMAALLTMVEFSFESEGALEQALVDYQEGSADFGEYLHLALSRKCGALPFWTFDRKAAKTAGIEMLS
ncbi:PIN domain-containing protein [Rhodoferax sp.]|uniref:PIN domain-containing protein n=1 Tax=Rhodoferax sp. TaxID=50421 RepID=UPI00260FFBA9|nr:type II toxin-antitoxin system VapC family toxin [Rhodoferax sp.]MDD2927203.1 type II toxin-antitoxin system VapC family toxin [Rhodoferax sp.]